MQEHHIAVQRTARYATLGPDDGSARDVWFVLHGQGQLAGRFLRSFTPLDDGARLLVAPEALSRFYVDRTPAPSGETPRVGATWMTREDRDSDINDYVAYLDALYGRVFSRVPRESARVTVLGFSQGAATASRWAALGGASIDRLICWGGTLANDLLFDGAGLRGARLTLVAGTVDEFATPDVIAAEEERLRGYDVAYEIVRFAGGHHIDPGTLHALATG